MLTSGAHVRILTVSCWEWWALWAFAWGQMKSRAEFIRRRQFSVMQKSLKAWLYINYTWNMSFCVCVLQKLCMALELLTFYFLKKVKDERKYLECKVNSLWTCKSMSDKHKTLKKLRLNFSQTTQFMVKWWQLRLREFHCKNYNDSLWKSKECLLLYNQPSLDWKMQSKLLPLI